MIAECITCAKQFQTKPAYIRKGGGKFCSSKCYGVSLKGVDVMKRKGKKFPDFAGENHPRHVKRIEKECICGNLFLIRETEKNKYFVKHFCSELCELKKRSVDMLGEKNPSWEGGKTPIGRRIKMSLDYKLWRKAVFERDDYTCQVCERRGGVIQADHIKPFSLFPELRLDLNNGRTLCIECHRKTDTFGGRMIKYKYEQQNFINI